jgi:serine phosphatase RsbU (regulator of sigma subunit)
MTVRARTPLVGTAAAAAPWAALASGIVVALLMASVIEAERRRREAAEALYVSEHRVAETLQRALLPELPTLPGISLAARYVAGASDLEVGGDWFDVFPVDGGRVGIVIGDVMGHDVGAAAAMGQLRSLLRGTAYDRQESPARVLGRVDAALRGLRIDTLATALVARVEQAADQRERGTRTLRWSNAGHPPAVLRRVDGEVLTLAAEDGMLLGLDPSGDRHDHTVELCSGDTLLLYTDGLVERRDSPIAEGIERLCGALRELGGLPLDELCDALLARLLPEAPDDDVAVVAVRPRPVPPVPRPATGQVAPARRP